MKRELDAYIKNTAEIRGLSSPQLYTVSYASEYSRMLRENFVHIGELASENRDILDTWIFPYIQEPERIHNEEMETLGEFGDSLLDAYNLDNLDPAILSILSTQLLERAEQEKNDHDIVVALDREIMVCYTMVNITNRLTVCPEISEGWRERGFRAGDRLLRYIQHDRFLSLDDEARAMVIINARYMWVLYEGRHLSEAEAQKNYERLEWALGLADDPFYLEAMPDYDWRNHRFRTLQYLALALDNHNFRGFPQELCEKICGYVEELIPLWDSDPDYYVTLATRDEVMLTVLRVRYECGRISRDEFYSELLALYENRDITDYDLSGMTLGLIAPNEYLLSLDKNNITEAQTTQIEKFYHDALNYAFHMPNSGSFSFMLEYLSYLLESFVEIPGIVSFEEMCLNCLAALHPPTYVHSMMIGDITRCLTRHLYRRHPELFADMPEAGNEEALVSFAWHAGVCHDFGKITMIDTIFIYGRKLLDMEFGLIKKHPEVGAAMMERYESTKRYARVARGHHRWYDNSGGYPENMDTTVLPERAIISIVTCADCLDAATDTVGRSYNRGKTLDDFIEELREGSGTRYAPYLLELFDEPEVRADINYLLAQGRSLNYRKTYLLLKDLQEKGLTEKAEDNRSFLSIKKYKSGDVIFNEGDTDSDKMYEVQSGRVGIYLSYGTSDEKLLAEMGDDSIFGEMGLIEGTPRSATAAVLSDDTEIAAITWGDLERYFKNRPSRIVQIMRQTGERLRGMNKKNEEAQRVIEELCRGMEGLS